MNALELALRDLSRQVKGRLRPDPFLGDSHGLGALVRPRPSIQEHMEADSSTLLVAFGGIREGFVIPVFEFSNFTARFGVKRLFVRDLRQAWYHRGVPRHGARLKDVADYLGRLIAEHDPQRVVMTGVSAGGYAALVFGTIMRADVVLAISPQTVIDPEVLAALDDHRWDAWAEALTAAHALDRDWADLREALPAAGNSGTRYEVYFAESDPLDKLHAERLGGLPRVKLFRFGRGGHFVVREMRASGALDNVLRRALEIDRGPDQPGSQLASATGQ
jgi:hypothetical protein